MSVELDLSDDDMLSSLVSFEAQRRTGERNEKEREDTKPTRQMSRREELLKEDKWLKEVANRLW